MDKKTKNAIFSKRELIKYSANRAYFGTLTGAGLSRAYGVFKHTKDWDRPIVNANVSVGKIDGGVICRALWHEMSYNPVRFGSVSPFVYKGREDIYHFCRQGVSKDFRGFEVVEKIRHKLIDFMMLNGRAKGQWYDNIYTTNGNVTIKLIDGHSDDNYKVLSLLRETIRLITSQNLEDFKRKSYRVQMLNVINARHPKGVRDNGTVPMLPKPVNIPLSDKNNDDFEDRMDKALESALITAETGQYRPENQLTQARADIDRLVGIKAHGQEH